VPRGDDEYVFRSGWTRAYVQSKGLVSFVNHQLVVL